VTARVLAHRQRGSPEKPAPHLFRVVLAKDGRHRLYEIRRAGSADAYQAWVRINGKPHRAKVTTSVVSVMDMRAQFEREIAELLLDGWIQET
jgi:hypothetical protein